MKRAAEIEPKVFRSLSVKESLPQAEAKLHPTTAFVDDYDLLSVQPLALYFTRGTKHHSVEHSTSA